MENEGGLDSSLKGLLGTEAQFDQGLRDYKDLVDSVEERMELQAGPARVFDVPQKGTPQGRPVMLVQGFAVDKPRYRNMYEISESGREVIALHQERYGGVVKRIRGEHTEDVRKARQIIEIIERKGIGDVDIIGKSGGAAGSLIAAILRPDLIRNVVLFNPSGMRKDSTLGIARRFIKKSKVATQKGLAQRDPYVDMPFDVAKREVTDHLFTNKMRTIQEIRAYGGADVNRLLRQAAQKGVMVSVMASVDDQYFPVEETIEKLRALKASGKDPSPFVGFYSVRGLHDDPLGDDAMRMRLCVNALENMEQVRQRRQ